MPGLSSDPKKAERQLAALRGGQVARARDLLASLGSAPAQPGHELGDVHTYPDEVPDDDPSPEAEPKPEPEPPGPGAGDGDRGAGGGGGFLASFRDGLTL